MNHISASRPTTTKHLKNQMHTVVKEQEEDAAR
jgi:hypothetical protein